MRLKGWSIKGRKKGNFIFLFDSCLVSCIAYTGRADLDEISRSLKGVAGMTAEAVAATLPMDDDKPGFGQFFCRETGRYFIVSWHGCS